MVIRVEELARISVDGEVHGLWFEPGLNLIVGPKNSSKTTVLKMIDFCLGDADSVRETFPTGVTDDYVALQLRISIDDRSHVLLRALDQSVGLVTKIQVDDELSLSPRELSDWLMRQSEWPLLQIPKGRVARLATDQVPLTFRNLLRHIYRKEESWHDFAVKEEEFHRRAVTAFFLGIAENRYSPLEFRIGQLEREVASLEAELRSTSDVIDETIAQVAQDMKLGALSLGALDSTTASVREELLALQHQRRGVLDEMRATPGFVESAANEYEAQVARHAALEANVAALSELVAGYADARDEISSQVERVQRAGSAIAVFENVPVKVCPVCQEAPPLNPTESLENQICYLCRQDATLDVRERRASLEVRALQRELAELEEVLTRSEQELATRRQQRDEAATAVEASSRDLDRLRREVVAPFLTELETISRRTGHLEQQVATLTSLAGLAGRREAVQDSLRQRRIQLDTVEHEAAAIARNRATAAERCAELADLMNDFLQRLQAERWTFGAVTLPEEELQFYVGTRPWADALGGEARVLLFLSYHYALMLLQSSQPPPVRTPRLALLDNPIQHGLKETAVAESLNLLGEAAEEVGGQVICTLAREVNLSARANVVRLRKTYGGTTDR